MDLRLGQIEELIFEVENKLFIPKKFRKGPFTDEIRTRYVNYLKRELKKLRERANVTH